MRKFIQILFIAILIATSSSGQVTQLNNNSPAGTPFLGWNGMGLIRTLEIRNDFNQPINFFTNSTQRMRLNANLSNTINGGTAQARNGFLLLGQSNNLLLLGTNIYGPSVGTFSLLHLNGDGTSVQELGHRPWMNTEIYC